MFPRLSVLCQKYLQINQIRLLNLQEFQSKDLLRQNGCIVQNFFVAGDVAEAKEKIIKTDFKEYVVKAQILAGGRGKGQIIGSRRNLCGIYISTSQEDILDSIDDMLNKRLVTKQTGLNGALVKKVMVAESIVIKRETYLAILLDRCLNGPVIVASPEGGVEIEEIAKTKPFLILKEPILIDVGVTIDQCEKVARFLKFPDNMIRVVACQIQNLYRLFINVDATQIEINPLAETDDSKVYCVDAKLNFDDNASFRQKNIFQLDNIEEDHDIREVEAKKFKLNYIGLEGNIACLVNGAGLAMATMDIIKLFGGCPANFLDVGGSVTEDQVFNAFRIFTMDPNIKAFFVNIFGGIVNCITIAHGLVQALERLNLHIPLVVRLEGTNVEQAKYFLKKSEHAIFVEHGLDNAARRAVKEAERFDVKSITALL